MHQSTTYRYPVVFAHFPQNVSSVSINSIFSLFVITSLPMSWLEYRTEWWNFTGTNRTRMVIFYKNLTEARRNGFVVSYWGAQQPYSCYELLRPISWMIRCSDYKHILTHETGLYGSFQVLKSCKGPITA
jgi:hypothetical protein